MRDITIRKSFDAPLSEDDLSKLEQDFDLTLPTDYKRFLLQHNGGRPTPNRFPIADNRSDNKGILEWLFGVHEGECTI